MDLSCDETVVALSEGFFKGIIGLITLVMSISAQNFVRVARVYAVDLFCLEKAGTTHAKDSSAPHLFCFFGCQ